MDDMENIMDKFGQRMSEQFAIVMENVASRFTTNENGTTIRSKRPATKRTSLPKRRSFNATQLAVGSFV